MSKARDLAITPGYLATRITRAVEAGYPKAKWVEFCEVMLSKGFRLSLYEARQTFSKYITVRHNGKSFKVRFSNHKPNKQRELSGDCDFFVGVCHTGTTTTAQAIAATLEHMGADS